MTLGLEMILSYQSCLTKGKTFFTKSELHFLKVTSTLRHSHHDTCPPRSMLTIEIKRLRLVIQREKIV